jgi:hypothetical protein
MSELHDAEFKYMRGTGRKRHRGEEPCYSNAQSPNQPRATLEEPRCKVCEENLERELRK